MTSGFAPVEGDLCIGGGLDGTDEFVAILAGGDRGGQGGASPILPDADDDDVASGITELICRVFGVGAAGLLAMSRAGTSSSSCIGVSVFCGSVQLGSPDGSHGIGLPCFLCSQDHLPSHSGAA